MENSRYEELTGKLIRSLTALIGLILGLVVIATLTGRPPSAQEPGGAIIAEREILLWGNPAGAARISTGEGEEILTFASGKGGFVSTIDRVLRRERLRYRIEDEHAYLLRLREGDRVSIFDPSTGKELELESFGSDNVGIFEGLLAAAPVS